tara:strand:+ start:551 stop:1576 length:1026 start_codon:yes stop_codon:yes gene_type:complete
MNKLQNNIIYFIFDVGGEFGLGHLKRCQIFGKEFIKNGFFCHYYYENFHDINLSKFISFKNSFIKVIKNKNLEIIYENKPKPLLTVIDKKYIDKNFISSIKKYSKVLQIDDFKRELNADYILNTNHFLKEIKYKGFIEKNIMFGKKYNLIDKYYFNLKNNYQINSRNILISMGGEDPNNHTLKILRLLRKLDKSICKKIIIGPSHPNPKSIRDECNQYHLNFSIISSPNSLKRYFQNINIAFSACGLTLRDLIASGIPTIGIPIEKDQEYSYKNFLSNNLVFDIKELEKLDSKKIFYIDDFFPSINRSVIREACKDFYKSPGANVIVKWLIEKLYQCNFQD